MEESRYKKIRILSFQNAYNFGAILQAYGLQQTIKSMGYEDVEFINYNPNYLSGRYTPFTRELLIPYKNIKGFIGWCIRYPFFMISRLHRNLRMQSSIDTMLVQTKKKIVDLNGLSDEEADVLICGSDQIWNTSLTGNFDLVYFGAGPYKHLGYAVSYAPSTELSALTDERAQEISKLLDNFKYISVRETQVKDKIRQYLNKDIHVCVDPTILCGSESFHKAASSRLIKKDYIIVYAYDSHDPLILEMIKSIPDYQKYSVHFILLESKNVYNFFDTNIHAAITVQDFLSYIKYAKYVVTNSFHGLAFSLLFEKNFNVAYCEGKYVRCLSLLQQLGLESRFVHKGDTCNWNQLDYGVIDKKMSEIREKSRIYLKEALDNENKDNPHSY